MLGYVLLCSALFYSVQSISTKAYSILFYFNINLINTSLIYSNLGTLVLPSQSLFHSVSLHSTLFYFTSFYSGVLQVLATDMTKHMDHVAHLKTIVETRRIVSPVSSSSSASSSASCTTSVPQVINLENYNDRIHVRRNWTHSSLLLLWLQYNMLLFLCCWHAMDTGRCSCCSSFIVSISLCLNNYCCEQLIIELRLMWLGFWRSFRVSCTALISATRQSLLNSTGSGPTA